MAATSVTFEAHWAGNKPLSVLQDLIAKREQFLKNETTENAVVATAINVLSSLKPQTKVARKEAADGDFEVRWCGESGWRGGKGNRRRAPIVNGHRVKDVFPVNNMYGLNGTGNLYRVTLTNKNIWPKVAKNAPVYYVMAPDATVARKFAVARVNRALKRESGLARGVIGYAQAKASNRPMSDAGAAIVNKGALIATAAKVTTGGDGRGAGSFWFQFEDELNYSMRALKGDVAAIDIAMMKAANRTAGLINHLAGFDLDEQIPTPFPEVKR